MNLITKLMGLVVFSIPPAVALAACTVESGATLPEATDPANETDESANGLELLHSVQLEGSHRFDFLRLKDGSLATRESMDIGDGQLLSQRMKSEPTTMVDVFRFLAPNQAVPSKLIDADRRNEEARLAAAKRPPNPHFVPPPSDLEPTGGPWSGSDLASSQQSLLACSGDLLNDNWGAQWFLNNYCYAGPGYTGTLYFQQCQVNWGWADSWTEHQVLEPGWLSGFRYRQFEGDFSNSGYGDLFRWYCDALTGWNCYWAQLVANVVVKPRKLFEWYFWQSFDANYYNDGTNYSRWKARSPCGHLDFAAIADWCVNLHQC